MRSAECGVNSRCSRTPHSALRNPNSHQSPYVDCYNGGSCQQLANDVAVDVGEAEIPAGMTECQSGMVEAQQGEQSRMQGMNVNLVFGRFKSEFIGRPMNVAAARAAAGQPHAESVMIVITAIDFSGVGARR